MERIRRGRHDEHDTILAIVNSAAEAYHGVIPADCWHEPYMSGEQLASEVDAGVEFWVHDAGDALAGVMGIQRVRDVELIRHAYVLPSSQRLGVGGDLLAHLLTLATGTVLVGTWADATWAIRFYQRHGFTLVDPERTSALLEHYWTISARQAATSVVLEWRP
jgi:GNAT superfamily N-acetyltransferase